MAITDWATSDPTVKDFANKVLANVKSLEARALTLPSIETWTFVSIAKNLTTDSSYATAYNTLNAQQKSIFDTLSGLKTFENGLSQHSFNTADVTAIAKSFSEGAIVLKNAPDAALMSSFYDFVVYGHKGVYFELQFGNLMRSLIENYKLDPSPSPSFSPHTPASTQDLEQELSTWEASDPSVKDFADKVLAKVKNLDGSSLPLSTIEAWAYAAAVGNLTTDPSYSTAYKSLTTQQEGTFDTLSGLKDFESKLSAHSLDAATVTALAKSFSDGTIALKKAQDKALMVDFSANLQAKQDPKTAAQNAYGKVLPSSVSSKMNTFIQGLSGYSPAPPSFSPHTPASIKDLEQELSSWETSDPSVKDFADKVLTKVKNLDGSSLSLSTIEAWVYAAIVGNLTTDSSSATAYKRLTTQQEGIFDTLSGLKDFESKLSAHSLDTTTVTAIAKSFSDGTITLKNAQDKTLMVDFSANLQAKQDPKTAAQNAYEKVTPSSVSNEMNVFMRGLSGYAPANPFPSPFSDDTVVDKVTMYSLNILF